LRGKLIRSLGALREMLPGSFVERTRAEIHNPDIDGLSKLLEALDPWLPQIVIVGGWAHRLFRYHPLAQTVQYEPLLTLDTDVALPVRLEVREQDLRDRSASAGFKERFLGLGEHQPPATHYRLGDEEGSFYVEFLTPLIGANMIGTEIFAQQLGWQESHHRTYATWTSCWPRRGRSSCLERTDFL
jgi:hypothetical protein